MHFPLESNYTSCSMHVDNKSYFYFNRWYILWKYFYLNRFCSWRHLNECIANEMILSTCMYIYGIQKSNTLKCVDICSNKFIGILENRIYFCARRQILFNIQTFPCVYIYFIFETKWKKKKKHEKHLIIYYNKNSSKCLAVLLLDTTQQTMKFIFIFKANTFEMKLYQVELFSTFAIVSLSHSQKV